ncbi:hypothetical protein ABW19_dt0208734 [Dactylella cylindrospora]|nr:hypothetical protein ABW19_dt0208734 [Dactylella cylindrospora]
MHRRSAASIATLNAIKATSTGLFDEYGRTIGILVDCYMEVQVVGLRSIASLRILFRNNSGRNVQEAIFRAKTANGAVVTSAECYVDVDDYQSAEAVGLEYRDITTSSQRVSMLECQIGSIQANRDCVMFLRYEHELTFDDNAAVVRFPLPGRRGEKLITRQKSEPGLWNASQIFSFIALEVQVVDYPERITNISSSHSINVSADQTSAVVEFDDYIFQVRFMVRMRLYSGFHRNLLKIYFPRRALKIFQIDDELASEVRSLTELLPDDPACDSEHSLDLRSESEERILSHRSSLNQLEADAERKYTSSRCSHNDSPPPTVEVDGLYSDIWEVNVARMSYSSSEESSDSIRNSRIRRRKTTVHKKLLSNASSELSNLSEMSWLDDASDDEVNDEAERIFKEYSRARKRETLDLSALQDEFDVEECKSIRIVRHTRPKLVTISPKMPPITLENMTPPLSPVGSIADNDRRQSLDLIRELDNVLENLNHLLEDSPTPYLILNQEFASTLGLQLQPLKAHRGAQAYTLPDTPFWIREGIWANALALQFLQCVMDSPFFRTLDEEVRVEYRLLFSILEAAFAHHGQHLTPVARFTRISEEELMNMASDVIQELIDSEDQCSVNDKKGKQVDKDQFVARPLSPPKTPDDDDRKKADVDAFVDCFEY